MNYTYTYQTPLGNVTIAQSGDYITNLCIGAMPHPEERENTHQRSDLLDRAATQLEEYIAGERLEFDLPIEARGTEFECEVWQALLSIPLGETKSYGDIAKMIGRPKAARAVGGAVGANPIAVIIPCHRVISANGAIGGFSAGLDIKRILLKIEGIKIERE